MPATPDQNVTTTVKASCACNSIVNKYRINQARAACVGDAIYTHDGKSFCVMHYPSQNKIEAFRDAFIKKIKAEDFNFCGVYFPQDIDFSAYKKEGDENFCFTSRADFISSTFTEVANFSRSTFYAEAFFASATFTVAADFRSVTFSAEANFMDAMFSAEVNFASATFTAAYFMGATFSGLTLVESTSFAGSVSFYFAQFKDYVKFKSDERGMFGTNASLNFDSLRIEKPERLSFHSVKLRPHWFINTDPRKFEFIDVRWDDDLVKEREASKSDRLLSIAYRQLAVNAEENSRYDDAMDFRKKSMETSLFSLQKKWREDWLKKRWRNYSIETFSWWWEYGTIRKLFSLTWWYRTLSSYGESPTRAAIVLLLILFLSCVPYWLTGFASSKDTAQNKICAPIQVMLAPEQNKAKQFLATLVYSLETASLQKPEPRPVTTMARLFVGLETILAPLQAALLALAIRRKYMR